MCQLGKCPLSVDTFPNIDYYYYISNLQETQMLFTQTTKNSGTNVTDTQILRTINDAGRINLTDIVKTLNPNFDFDNVPKTNYRYQINNLVNEGHIDYTMKGKRRNEYFIKGQYVEKSKRVIFSKFVSAMRTAKWL